MQRALNLKLKSDATFDNFIVGSNTLIIELIKKMTRGIGEQSCFIWSQKGEGISHILQAAHHQANKEGVSSIYLPLYELKSFGLSILNEIEQVSLVCLDDVDSLAGDILWEEALFHAYNRLIEKGHRLILGAHHSLVDCKFSLPDLVSRFAWGVCSKLQSMNDDEKACLLQLNASKRGFELPMDVVNYLLTRYSRDWQAQLMILERLDRLSLQEKHKITLPFIKSKLL